MRVKDRINYNRLRLNIETDGTIAPREVLERSIATMIHQLKAIVGFQEEDFEDAVVKEVQGDTTGQEAELPLSGEEDTREFLKTRIESLALSTRTENALASANIRTVGGLVRKKEGDLLDIEGLGEKGLQEIRRALANYGIILRQ
jgi:DNA-directed RNA polymerase subunit alpha